MDDSMHGRDHGVEQIDPGRPGFQPPLMPCLWAGHSLTITGLGLEYELLSRMCQFACPPLLSTTSYWLLDFYNVSPDIFFFL